MTEIETLKIRVRKYIKENNISEIINLRDELLEIVLECDKALEISIQNG